ncbi:hypothetical protein FA95DRAFT_1567840 [Auriscalpium vulgare]|uniref:Uncharacterized protein n=1 Tax=Auriscalpium vulgare TaxID=40419 RepID=A0ACB8R404_9AGAM|nr:hypothetical protein FA95DRAFT_1567840 [Auriscalpium vulgare]
MHHVARTEAAQLGIHKLVRAAIDVFSAASFITQHLSLDQGQICLFIKNSSFVVDNNDLDFKVVVGLPSRGAQLHPVTMMGWAPIGEKWNRSLSFLIGERILHALETATLTGYYYTVSTIHLLATLHASLDDNNPVPFPSKDWSQSLPFDFLMEIPMQSQVGDVGYVTATSPIFHPMFNILKRDPTATHSFDFRIHCSQNGIELGNMSAPIFRRMHEDMVRLGDRRFKSTLQFLPPTTGTTRRLLSFEYNCNVVNNAFRNANSLWTGSEPKGIELYLMEVFMVTFIDTYWLDCSVEDLNSQCAASSTNGNLQETKPQELKFDLIAEWDAITSSRQVQLVGVFDTEWSTKYKTTLTLLKTRGPRFSVTPLSTGQYPDDAGRYSVKIL